MSPTPDNNSEPEPHVDPSLVASSLDTATALAKSSGRTSGATPIRRTFVQPSDRNEQAAGGPLADMVRRRDHRALVLYLMILTLASAEPWNVCRDARIWARLLDLSDTAKGRNTISKILRRLQDTNLITVERRKRHANITILNETGNNTPYTYPEPAHGDRYLKLPLEFWTNGWYQKLDTPGLAMLLILLAEKDGVVLPIDRIPDWYGISRATAQRGFTELDDHGIHATWDIQRVNPLDPNGYTFDRHHRLTGDFQRTTTKTKPTETKAENEPITLRNFEPAPSAAQRRRARRKTQTNQPRKEEHHGT